MIGKPQGYDDAQAFTGEYVSLPAGCYVCTIKQASMAQAKNTGRDQLVILFDIAEGEYQGFCEKQFKAAKEKKTGATWPGTGTYRQAIDGSSLPFFKGLMTSIEKSNPRFQFPWGQEGNEKTLVGKKIGVIMRREEFLTDEKEKRMSTKPIQIRSLDGLKDAKVPEDKLLDEAAVPPAAPQYGPADKDGFMNIPDGIDEELPFM